MHPAVGTGPWMVETCGQAMRPCRLQPARLCAANLDEHGGLVVRVSGEDLLLLGGHGGVARDEHRHDAARRLQAQAAGRAAGRSLREAAHGTRVDGSGARGLLVAAAAASVAAA